MSTTPDKVPPPPPPTTAASSLCKIHAVHYPTTYFRYSGDVFPFPPHPLLPANIYVNDSLLQSTTRLVQANQSLGSHYKSVAFIYTYLLGSVFWGGRFPVQWNFAVSPTPAARIWCWCCKYVQHEYPLNYEQLQNFWDKCWNKQVFHIFK